MTQRCIALLGVGHTNAHIVKQWATQPMPSCRLVCISKFPTATYSGMLPGTLAGQFTTEEMQIDLRSLANKANAELMLAEVTGLDTQRQMLHFSNAEPLHFDVLSVGVGSMPAGCRELDSESVVPIKPMQTFLPRLDERLDFAAGNGGQSVNVAIVGGGVAGIEIALCLRARVAEKFSDRQVSIQIFTSSDDIGDGLRKRSVRLLRRLLSKRGIHVITNCRVTGAADGNVVTSDGSCFAADCVIWSTGAVAPPVLASLGLPTDDRGFLATDRTLQTTAGQPIFAVGDSGTVVQDPSPKSGVYAVRQAPVLWHNLQATLDGKPLQEFHAQRDFLKILNTGDGKALLEYKGFSIHARWCMKLKTWIDKRFIAPYQIDAPTFAAHGNFAQATPLYRHQQPDANAPAG